MPAFCPHCNHGIMGYPYDNLCPICNLDLHNAAFEYDWKEEEKDMYELIEEYVPECEGEG